MIDINKLKAGDCITRISHSCDMFTTGKSYKLFDTTDGVAFNDNCNNVQYLFYTFHDYWEQSNIEEKPTQAHVKHLPMLLDYLRQHSIKAWWEEDINRLVCQAIYTRPASDSDNGKAYSVLEEVEPNLKAVRDWLGY